MDRALDRLAEHVVFDGKREVGAISLAWPSAQVGVFGEWEAECAAWLTARGWTLFPAAADPDDRGGNAHAPVGHARRAGHRRANR